MEDEEGDDEELPFSAEQSDQLSVDHNKVKIRRNQINANANTNDTPGTATAAGKSNTRASVNTDNNNNNNGKRKMVRRGMEMLVGGVPINADPPQRSTELIYDPSQPWYAVISTNSRDFGPFLHSASLQSLSRMELGLFCEYFVHYALKWDVCPSELQDIVQAYHKRTLKEEQIAKAKQLVDEKKQMGSAKVLSKIDLGNSNQDQLLLNFANLVENDPRFEKTFLEAIQDGDLNADDGHNNSDDEYDDEFDEFVSTLSDFTGVKIEGVQKKMLHNAVNTPSKLNQKNKGFGASGKSAAKGFGTPSNKNTKSKGSPRKHHPVEHEEYLVEAEGEVCFTLGISKEELLTGGGEQQLSAEKGLTIFKDVLSLGIRNCLDKELHPKFYGANSEKDLDEKFSQLDKIEVLSLEVEDQDDGTISVTFTFVLKFKPIKGTEQDGEKAKHRLNRAMQQAVDDGEIPLAMAAATKEETRWPEDFRDRIYEEFLFEEDEEDRAIWENDNKNSFDQDISSEKAGASVKEISNAKEEAIDAEYSKDVGGDKYDNDADEEEDDDDDNNFPFGMEDESEYHDMFMGGGNDGVFWDYSEANSHNAPFQGKLGPELLEAVEKRAEERPPKVITIGDVHGCVDELQDLLRQCDYHPGDLIVFLGDLVSKGPDSISVVQMSREIGAIGVRGNHDFEVIRWHQAIKSGTFGQLLL